MEWNAVFAEATSYLQQLLRINTTNPPGNEIAAIRWLEQILRKEGCEPVIIEGAPGRANLVCRLRGTSTHGPLLLSSHVDVVPAEAEKWTHPPFGGDIADGMIWGRGALDMKSMTILGLMAFLLAKRKGWPLARDLIFAAVADEECETRYGSAYLVQHHPELIRAEFALNEGGGYTLHFGRHRLYPIQVAEKGLVWVKVVAQGRPGHGSAPHDAIATLHLGRALRALRRRRLGYHRTPVASAFLREVARASSPIAALALRALTTPGLGRLTARLLPENQHTPFLRALVHNTVCPNALAAGSATAINVIPSEAALWIDGRILPGQTQADFLRELAACVGPGYEYEVVRYREPTVQNYRTALYEQIATGLAAADPGARTAPFMLTGLTDAHFYKKIGITTYGFHPLQLPSDLHPGRLAHAHDERIPVAGFQWGVQTFSEVVRRFVTR